MVQICVPAAAAVHCSLKEKGVSLAATPKETHTHLQIINAFNEGVFIMHPLEARNAAVVPVFVFIQIKEETLRVWLAFKGSYCFSSLFKAVVKSLF